ncbi:MAG: helix-turn-helix transcriptional regulator [Verrucomicrobiota bacterium JB025]|nr:winged helix-turn-helix transcriptional regulator [Verrucomicrobiota bacterium JB025]
MLLPVFRDLVKPQWRKILELIKLEGGMPVSDLARNIGGSYMGVKNHCDELTKLGYLIRTRLPRTAVGRPEIFYSLGQKSTALFPQAGADFTLTLLDETRRMFGESAPEKLLFQYFNNVGETWRKQLDQLATPQDRAAKLATLRAKSGCASLFQPATGDTPARILETHNPLQQVFDAYPRATTMEQRMLEQLVGTSLNRVEIPTGRESPPNIAFELP